MIVVSKKAQSGPFTEVYLLETSNARDQYYRVNYGKNHREAAVVRFNPDGWNCRTCGAMYCAHVGWVKAQLAAGAVIDAESRRR